MKDTSGEQIFCHFIILMDARLLLIKRLERDHIESRYMKCHRCNILLTLVHVSLVVNRKQPVLRQVVVER